MKTRRGLKFTPYGNSALCLVVSCFQKSDLRSTVNVFRGNESSSSASGCGDEGGSPYNASLLLSDLVVKKWKTVLKLYPSSRTVNLFNIKFSSP